MRWSRLHSVGIYIPACATSISAHHKRVPRPMKRWSCSTCTFSKQKIRYYRIKSIQISKSEPQTERVHIWLRHTSSPQLLLAFCAGSVGKFGATQRYNTYLAWHRLDHCCASTWNHHTTTAHQWRRRQTAHRCIAINSLMQTTKRYSVCFGFLEEQEARREKRERKRRTLIVVVLSCLDDADDADEQPFPHWLRHLDETRDSMF